ncbi:Hypothetical protein D9617_4g003540 [Elsinoe fawcettii]|nr:Hypothetical protein D9617_4g003540 [Elsinoe fawcettii]
METLRASASFPQHLNSPPIPLPLNTTASERPSSRPRLSPLPSLSISPTPPSSTQSPNHSPPRRRRSFIIITELPPNEDPGYESDLDVLHPDETEEAFDSSASTPEPDYMIAPSVPDIDDDSPDTDTGVTRRFSRLRCDGPSNDCLLPEAMRHKRKAVGESRGMKRARSYVFQESSEDADVWIDAAEEERRQRRKMSLEQDSSEAEGKTLAALVSTYQQRHGEQSGDTFGYRSGTAEVKGEQMDIDD